MPQNYMTGEQRREQLQQELDALDNAQDQQVADTRLQQESQQQQPDTVNWEKRYKDAQSHFSKQVTELKSKIPAQDFETENEKLQRQVAELHGDLNARNVADKVREAQAAVGQVHPDFNEVIASEAFATWIKVQPEVFYKSIYDDVPNASLAIKALTLFKIENQPQQPEQRQPQQQQQQQRQQPDPASMQMRHGMREVPNENGPKVWTMKEIQSLTPAQYEQHEAAIDAAFVAGRIR